MRFYETSNTPLYEGVDAEMNLANSRGVCINEKIILLGVDSLGEFDPATNSLNQQVLGQFTEPGASVVKDNGSFAFIDVDAQSLVMVAEDSINRNITDISQYNLTGTAVELATANEDEAVFLVRDYEKDDLPTLVTIDARNGEIVEETKLKKNVVAVGQYNDDKFILQYSDGETKIVDNRNHLGNTISKFAFTEDVIFTHTISALSEFIVHDGFVWYNADGWGLIGLRASE